MTSAVFLAGCQLGGTPAQGAEPSPSVSSTPFTLSTLLRSPAADEPPTVPKAPITRARIAIEPATDARNVRPDRPVRVRTTGGWLTRVEVTGQRGERIAGVYDVAKAGWTASSRLSPDTTYKIEAEAVNAGGAKTVGAQTFRTLRPAKDNLFGTDITPSNGSTVGVGMPIIVEFTHAVKNRAAVQRQLTVRTSKPVEGSWHWFSSREVHYRPKKYWPAHTKVTLGVQLRGVGSGTGAWGIRDKTRTFTIGRSVVTKVNLYSHRATVYVDGKAARTIPVTGGKPGWETRRGTKLILGRQMYKRFTNEQIDAPEDYDLVAKYAMRVTNSGEFLHTAHWSTGHQGRRNVSHGCVGMNTRNSAWLYRLSKVGDPVEVASNGRRMAVRGNGYGDWNMSWSKWKAGSALR